MKDIIEQGQASLGIEFGSTRIKAVLVDANNIPIATGNHDWENRFENQVWTYSLEDIQSGLQGCYRDLARDVKEKYSVTLTRLKSIGISGMMHGYLAFNKNNELLVPFRTWRNTTTGASSAKLSELFAFNIPQRWSISHLYQAILNEEEHVKDIHFITTLAGLIHYQLTSEKVMGVGEASGMFPIDTATKDFDGVMLRKFTDLIANKGYPWKIDEILPQVLLAGQPAGVLTEAGAKLIDPSGHLQAGIPFCPAEGDAGTGMVATNSVKVRTGNVSAGTSVFAMAVLEKDLSRAYEEIDLVTTPSGELVAMVHCNNGTSDLSAWVNIFKEFADAAGFAIDTNALFKTLYEKALEGEADCGGLLAYNYMSGEHITGFEAGRPLFVRTPESNFNLANFMRVHLFTSLGALKTGMDILLKKENVQLDKMLGHGGLFKTAGVGQRVMAAAINTPVFVMETAAEGGAWGIAVLASYLVNKGADETLEDFLTEKVFHGKEGSRMNPDPQDVQGYEKFMQIYAAGLKIERAAVEVI
jgi:sugar (pentulose or hexulose) kinase